MVFFKGRHVGGAVSVYQFPGQCPSYEARELTFANFCPNGCG